MLNNPVMLLDETKSPIHFPTREAGIKAGKAHINTILNSGLSLRDLCIHFKLSPKHLFGNFPPSLKLTPDMSVWDIID